MNWKFWIRHQTDLDTSSILECAAIGEMAGDMDIGENDFTDATGQASTDDERDTELATSEVGGQTNDTENAQVAITSVDPTTGIITNASVTDGGSDKCHWALQRIPLMGASKDTSRRGFGWFREKWFPLTH